MTEPVPFTLIIAKQVNKVDTIVSVTKLLTIIQYIRFVDKVWVCLGLACV